LYSKNRLVQMFVRNAFLNSTHIFGPETTIKPFSLKNINKSVSALGLRWIIWRNGGFLIWITIIKSRNKIDEKVVDNRFSICIAKCVVPVFKDLPYMHIYMQMNVCLRTFKMPSSLSGQNDKRWYKLLNTKYLQILSKFFVFIIQNFKSKM
jgi:hypothetical protein